MKYCKCGCGKPVIGRQNFYSGACQKRTWRVDNPPEKSVDTPLEKAGKPPSFRECRGCGGWGETARPFICSECVRHGRAAKGTSEADIPVLGFALRDDPMRAVMVYYGLMNVYSRRSGEDMTEIVCGVEEAKSTLRWMTEKLQGEVTSDGVVFVSLVPTEALVSEALRQARGKEAVAA
jgi:hypothetical protein